MKNKLKTIDELCNKPPGSFKKYLEEQKAYARELEERRKARIRATKKK